MNQADLRNAMRPLSRQVAIDDETRTLAEWREPDWGLLRETIPCAPDFPVRCFGAPADYIRRAARGANSPPDYVGAMLLAAVGALTCKYVEVRISSDWMEPLAFWCAIVGAPSSGKTPACKQIRAKLFQMQSDLAAKHKDQMDAELRSAEIANASACEIAAIAEKMAHPPRYVINDSTVEALARIESRSSHGLLVERDELSGLIEGLERYSSGVDRPFYLEAFNQGGFMLDRVKAGTIAIPNHCFSIVGGIQPDRLRSLLTHSGDDDGFMARILVFWPELLRPGRIPEGADHSIMHRAIERIEALRSEVATPRLTLELATDSFSALNDWYVDIHGPRIGTPGKLGSAFGKLPGYAARLAGALHILDWAFDEAPIKLSTVIGEAHLSSALTLLESYFVPQLVRANCGVDLAPTERVAAELLNQCRIRGVNVFRLRDARRGWGIPGCRTSDSVAVFKAAAEFLHTSGWLRPKPTRGGSSDFWVNPALHSESS